MSDEPLAIVKVFKLYGYSLLRIRLWCYSLAFVHLVVTAFMTLSIDVTVDEDPTVQAYSRVRWKLITLWFNVMLLFYLPLCLYCDVWEGLKESAYVQKLRVLRDVVMTSILVPVITYSDVVFWVLYYTCPGIIAPPRLLEYMPYWAQHSLHTVSFVTVLMDLILTPRRRPKSMKNRLTLMIVLALGYCLMVWVSLQNGEVVYAFLSTAGFRLQVAVTISFLMILTLSFYAQWHLIDYVWGQKLKDNNLHKIN